MLVVLVFDEMTAINTQQERREQESKEEANLYFSYTLLETKGEMNTDSERRQRVPNY